MFNDTALKLWPYFRLHRVLRRIVSVIWLRFWSAIPSSNVLLTIYFYSILWSRLRNLSRCNLLFLICVCNCVFGFENGIYLGETIFDCNILSKLVICLDFQEILLNYLVCLLCLSITCMLLEFKAVFSIFDLCANW